MKQKIKAGFPVFAKLKKKAKILTEQNFKWGSLSGCFSNAVSTFLCLTARLNWQGWTAGKNSKREPHWNAVWCVVYNSLSVPLSPPPKKKVNLVFPCDLLPNSPHCDCNKRCQDLCMDEEKCVWRLHISVFGFVSASGLPVPWNNKNHLMVNRSHCGWYGEGMWVLWLFDHHVGCAGRAWADDVVMPLFC